MPEVQTVKQGRDQMNGDHNDIREILFEKLRACPPNEREAIEYLVTKILGMATRVPKRLRPPEKMDTNCDTCGAQYQISVVYFRSRQYSMQPRHLCQRCKALAVHASRYRNRDAAREAQPRSLSG